MNLCIISAWLIVMCHLYLGLYSFPQSDDFFSLKRVIDYGLWGTIKDVFYNWSGRLTPIFFNYASDRSGIFPNHTSLFVTTTIGLLCLSLAKLCARSGGMASQLNILDIAFLLLCLPANVKKDALYWFSGNITYLVPVILGAVTASYLHRNANSRYETGIGIALFVAFLFGSNLNEQAAAVYGIGAAGTLMLLKDQLQPYVRRRLWMILAGTAAGCVILLSSPGSYIRFERFQNLTFYSWYYTLLDFTGLLVSMVAYSVLRSRLLPAQKIAVGCRKHCIYLPAIIMLACFSAGIGVVIVGYKGGVPSPRTLLLPYCCLFIGAVILSRLHLWNGIRQYAKGQRFLLQFAIIIGLLMWAPLHGLRDLVHSLYYGPEQRDWVEKWFDDIHFAKLERHPSVSIEPLPYDTLLNVRHTFGKRDDPFRYNNRCLSHYFNIKVRP